MQLAKILVIAATCVAVSTAADARPRLFKIIGALAAGPAAIIAGAAGARAYGRHPRVASVPQNAAEPRSERRAAANSWTGPVYWAYAYDDIFDYVFGQPNAADRFWAHGYGDVLDGMFVPLNNRARGARPVMQVAENGSDTARSVAQSWQNMCGSQSSNPGEMIAARIRNNLQPTAEQTPLLDTLQESLNRANERIQAACPGAPTGDATDRLDLMAVRLLAMRQATSLVLPPLRKFYAALSDEQKTRFNTAEPSSTDAASNSVSSGAMGCKIAGNADWPAARLARRVAPKRDQLADLEMLRQTSGSFANFVATTCVPGAAQSPADRLDAAQKRLNVLRYAVRHVSPAVEQFYSSLSAPQKMRFSSLGR